VDAGCHLAAITSILAQHFPMQAPVRPVLDETPEQEYTPQETVLSAGPFAGLSFPAASARANAAWVVREHVSTYLITHPHLDHLSGFAMNTAAFHNTNRPKRLAALPFTVNAIKNHIFNDVIWPNLTDEDDGVGLVTFQRLAAGGNGALGDGESRGFIEVCNGLSVKGFKVSHGRCASKTPTISTRVALQDAQSRRGSLAPGQDGTTWTHSNVQSSSNGIILATDSPSRRTSVYASQPPTPTTAMLNQTVAVASGATMERTFSCVVDSSAYFIRAEQHYAPEMGREILIFGDVEPDDLSELPRNQVIWAEAAPKIISGVLKAVFLECSYCNAQPDERLYGHLNPKFLISEMVHLADMVTEQRRRDSAGGTPNSPAQTGHERERKRKRVSMGVSGPPPPSVPLRGMQSVDEDNIFDGPTAVAEGNRSNGNGVSTTDDASLSTVEPSTHQAAVNSSSHYGPLHGLTVVIIHVKDKLEDGPLLGDIILDELKAGAAEMAEKGKPLGCDFIISKSGESYWF
jgi:cAMP phosphodiesterase